MDTIHLIMNILANIAHLAWILHASCIPGKAICYTKQRESGVSGCIGMSDRPANHRTFDSCNKKLYQRQLSSYYVGFMEIIVLSQRCRLPLCSLFSIREF